MRQAQFDTLIDVNRKDVFNCAQAAAQTLRPQGSGSLFNTSRSLPDSRIVGNFGRPKIKFHALREHAGLAFQAKM